MNEITQDQKRIKIAEACGWGQPFGQTGDWQRPDGSMTRWCMVPDYFNDLNAMHEAEKVLEVYQQKEYEQLVSDNTCTMFKLHASAAVRAEAFGSTLNLW